MPEITSTNSNPQFNKLTIEMERAPNQSIYAAPQVIKYYVNQKLIITVFRKHAGHWEAVTHHNQHTEKRKFIYLARPLLEYGEYALHIYDAHYKDANP
jgi:hypothetical protein